VNMQQGRCRRCSLMLLGMLALLSGPGCLSFLNPIGPPPPQQAFSTLSIPPIYRNHVYIFMVHGMDPLDMSNLSGLRDYIHELGFIKTFYGQVYHYLEMKYHMGLIHEKDPLARFVLIGFSFGANVARELAYDAKEEGVPVDLLVYLGGNTLENTPRDRPAHVGHVVNILASGCIWNGCQMDNAINMHYDHVWHFGSPSHVDTRAVLAQELALAASRVRVVLKPPPLPRDWGGLPPAGSEEAPPPRKVSEEAPPPRKVKPSAAAPRDQWDFLKPPHTVDLSPAVPRPIGFIATPKGPSDEQSAPAK
jgi:hypothetical protein